MLAHDCLQNIRGDNTQQMLSILAIEYNCTEGEGREIFHIKISDEMKVGLVLIFIGLKQEGFNYRKILVL